MSDVSELPPLKDVIAAHALRATKALGQNFLLDLNLTRKIARAAAIGPDDTVIEIGPGPGGLTRALLLENAGCVHAIEYDERAIAALASLKDAAKGRLALYHQDALATDCLSFGPGGSRKIVANLPYNIATPLIIRWLADIHASGRGAYRNLTVMVQKEVAQRMTAAPDTKQYGRLSVLCQWLCDCRMCFDVPASAFVPPPKVTSTIVQMIPKSRADTIDFNTVEKLTASAFGQRRKTIRQSMKVFKDAVDKAGLDNNLRAENLTVKDFITLAGLVQ